MKYLLCAWHCSKHFIYIISNPHKNHYKIGTDKETCIDVYI